MTFGPITSWQIDGERVETVTDFIFLGSKIIVDGDCSHEIKRRLFLGRIAMTNLDSVLSGRDITLLTKAFIVEPMVFPVVMYDTFCGSGGQHRGARFYPRLLRVCQVCSQAIS